MRLDTVPAQRFADAAAHIAAECGWIDALLADHVRQLRASGRFDDDPMRGLYARADDILCELEAPPRGPPAHDRLRAAIDARAALAPPSLMRIAAAAGLDAFARGVLMLAAAPALDRRYRRAFGFAHNDMARGGPTPDLLIELLAPDARFAAFATFAATAPLFALGLVGFAPGEEGRPLADRALTVDDCVVQALLGLDCGPDARIAAALSTPPRDPGADFVLPACTIADDDGLVVMEASADTGQALIAARACAARGRGVRIVAIDSLLDGGLPVATAATLLAREAVLEGAALLLDARVARGPPGAIETLARRLAELVAPVFVAVRPGGWDGARIGPARVVALPSPDAEQRRRWWTSAVGPSATADRLAWSTRIGADAIATAAAAGDPEATAVAGTHRALPPVMRHVPPRWRREELILPAATLRQLDELTAFVAHWPQVLGRWGFGASHPQARACVALFAGPSGTGKTMAAGIVAATAGLQLYRVNLAAVFDKYIGETEKQLDRLFDAAAVAGVALLFDEADVLFGARTEQRDAHDRYANLSTAYILQRIEEHDGLVILSSNLPRNMDAAFARRLSHSIAFPPPDAAQRARLWRGVFPVAAELDSGIAWDEIAATFELSGGGIRNAALAAAYLATAERVGQAIGTPHILRGIARELEKSGRAPIAADFGRLAQPG